MEIAKAQKKFLTFNFFYFDENEWQEEEEKGENSNRNKKCTGKNLEKQPLVCIYITCNYKVFSFNVTYFWRAWVFKQVLYSCNYYYKLFL